MSKYIEFEKQGHKGSIDELIYYFPHLKEKVFAQLEDPEALYVVSQDDDFMSSNLYAYDNDFDAVLNANVFVRDNGWLNYRIVDSKMVFERGGFNYDNTFYLYYLSFLSVKSLNLSIKPLRDFWSSANFEFNSSYFA